MRAFLLARRAVCLRRGYLPDNEGWLFLCKNTLAEGILSFRQGVWVRDEPVMRLSGFITFQSVFRE